MTDDRTGHAGADAARLLLEESEQILRDLLEAVSSAADRTRRGELIGEADISGAIVALANTRTMVIQEIQSHDKRGELSEGVFSQDTHDFDAVRTLLGRQLDRIRNAAGTDEISE